MKKSVFVLFAIVLMILPMVLAVEIDVKTLSGQTVTVFLREPGAFDVLDFHQGTAVDGKVIFTSDFTKDLVDLQVNVGKNGDSLIVFKRQGVDATGTIDLYLPSEDGAKVTVTPFVEEVVEEEVEEVVEEEVEEVVEEEVEEVANSAITVNAVSSIKNILSSKSSYYVVGVILALFAIAFIIQVGRNKIGKGDFKVVKYGDDSRLEDAEKKLNEAKKELDDIKNRKKKLAEAKARFQKDKEELSKLE